MALAILRQGILAILAVFFLFFFFECCRKKFYDYKLYHRYQKTRKNLTTKFKTLAIFFAWSKFHQILSLQSTMAFQENQSVRFCDFFFVVLNKDSKNIMWPIANLTRRIELYDRKVINMKAPHTSFIEGIFLLHKWTKCLVCFYIIAELITS